MSRSISRGASGAGIAVLAAGLLVPLPRAAADGLEPSRTRPLDPDDAAQVIARAVSPGGTERSYAAGGRFVGDLDGDGLDDIVVQGAVDADLHVFFGDPSWAAGDGEGGALTLDPAGDVTIALPQGCRRNDDRVHFAPLGDIDDDGRVDLGVGCLNHVGTHEGESIEGAVVIYLGRADWPAEVPAPDITLWGSPAVVQGEVVLGHKLGVDVAAIGDVDADGFDDFAASAEPWSAVDRVPVFVFLGGPSPAMTLVDRDDAEWTLVGASDLRCLAPVEIAALGDIDGGGRADFAVACPEQPPLVDPENPEHVPNRVDIAYNAFLGEDLQGVAPGVVFYDARSFTVPGASNLGTRAVAHSAVGDLDGDGFDDFGIASFLSFTSDIGARFIAGHAPPWSDIQPLDSWPPFVLQDEVTEASSIDFAVASDLSGDERPDLWLRRGEGAAARIGRIPEVDVEQWDTAFTPPEIVAFTPPGGVASAPGRFGLGGTGDADGDGNTDLLITSGYADGEGCDPAACGGFWLVLCRDADGDGVSPCMGDCDDDDSAVAPGLVELCDPVDHDCDGDPGDADADADGVQACAGDCDDTDPDVSPLAEETCESTVDANCDGLLPGDDQDGDGSANCEDCQPFDAAMSPGAPELCDGLDNDCDGRIPMREVDVDRDGLPACEPEAGGAFDCDDLDPLVGPHRHEDCGNGRDDDCDGVVDDEADADGDGVSTCDGDCDDADPTVFPGAPEFPAGATVGACDGLDNDCNGVIDDPRDIDGDGVTPCGGDCDESDPSVHAGAVGACDGENRNCDFVADTDDFDGDGWSACAGDCDDADPGIGPAVPEFCDRRDNDCDGVVDGGHDLDSDGWVGCQGDCADEDDRRMPRIVEPDCDDGVDGDCDQTADATDTDCFVEPPPPDPEARPYGLSCASCGSEVAGRGGPGPLMLLALLAFGARRRDRAAGGLLVLGVLLAAGSASAAGKGEPGLVVYMADLPDIRYQVEARELLPDIAATDILHTSEFLRSESGNLVVAGASASRGCGGGPGPELRSVVGRVLDRLIGLDYRGADTLIAATLEDLPCLREPLPRRLLPDLLFYRAVAHHSLGRIGEAEEDFQRLLAVDPGYPGDPNFPPSVGEQLEGVRAKATSATVPMHAFATPGTDVRVDGVEVDTRRGAVDVRPGRHLVQLTRGRTTFSAEVDLAPGDAPVVLLTGDRARALLAPGLHPAARAYAAAAVRSALLDEGVDLAAWVDLDQGDGVAWIYRVSMDRFSFEGDLELGGRRTAARGPRSGERAAAGPAPRAAAAPRAASAPAPSGREDSVRLRLGGGFLFLEPFAYARIPVDLGVRLVRGLHLDVGGGVAIVPTETYGAVWIPEVEIGASYRFELPDVQPRVGAAAVIGVDSSTGVIGPRPGFLVRGGVDFVPPARPLLLGVDVQAGVSGGVFRFAVAAGAGVRF